MRKAMILASLGSLLSLASAPVSSAQPELLAPGALSQQRISVRVEGAGEDIILIPGLASSREVWRGLASRLRQHYRLHLVQVAGFAGEPAVADPQGMVAAPTAAAVADYIRSQHIKAPVIIGHSLGGEVALMLGARYPGYVGRLIIVDALPFYTLLIDPSATSETAAPHAAAMRASMLAASPEQAEAMQHASIARLAKTEAVRPGLFAASTLSDRNTVADAVHELMVTDLRPELGHIKAPVEVVYAYDALFGVPAPQVDGLFRNAYAATPNIAFKRIDGSFHFIMLDQAEPFASAVEAFLKR